MRSHVNRYSSLMWVAVFVPGGENYVAAKLSSPKMYVYTDIFGLMRDERKRFRVIFAWCINLSHLENRKLGSTLARPGLK